MAELLKFADDGPTWRWDTCIKLVEERRAPSRSSSDELLRQAVRFLRRRQTATEQVELLQLKRDFPVLCSAYQLFEDPRSERWLVEAGLLTTATPEEIGAFIGKSPEVVRMYGELFYDVAEKRQSRGYILNKILVPAVCHGMHNRDRDFMYKTLCYTAGWKTFTEYIDDMELSADSRKFLETNFKDQMLKLGYAASHRIEVNSYTAMQIIEHCIQLKQLEADKGSPLAFGEAWQSMNILLQRCVTTIMSDETPVVDEQRVDGSKQLTYGEPIPLVKQVAEV